jgi:adenosylcobinamide-GDP ribazoletransferase
MLNFVRHYLLAVQFFTRVPITGRLAGWVGFSPAMLRASAAHFPGVGWLVGGAVAALSWMLCCAFPPIPTAYLAVAVLGTVFTVLMTGAFHEDGLADVADGLGGALDRERALDIMKDSRVGAFGAIAVALALMSKIALLMLLGGVHPSLLLAGLFAGHVISRTWPLLTIRLLPHVGDTAQSKSKPLADQISYGALGTASLWCSGGLAVAAGILFTTTSLSLQPMGFALSFQLIGGGMLVSGLAWIWMHRLLVRRLQGFTGDCLGAIQQVTEISFYLGLVVMVGAWSPFAGTLAGVR